MAAKKIADIDSGSVVSWDGASRISGEQRHEIAKVQNLFSRMQDFELRRFIPREIRTLRVM